MPQHLLQRLFTRKYVFEGLVGIFRFSLHSVNGFCLVLFRVNGLGTEAGLAHDSVVKPSMLAVATFVAQKAIKVFVIDITAQPTLKSILATVPTDTMPVCHRTIAARAEHALCQACSSELMECRELDHHVGCYNGDGQLSGCLELVCGNFKHSELHR